MPALRLNATACGPPAHGKTIRIATKSVRVPGLIARALSRRPDVYRGTPWRALLRLHKERSVGPQPSPPLPSPGLMCYSPREALFLYETLPHFGVVCDDFLVAYPVYRH